MSKEKKKSRKRDLTKGVVWKHLLRLGIPMTIGIFAVMSASIVDTYWVSKLGTDPLAGIAFCVPVLFVMQSLSVGLGAGASSVVSRAAGEGDHDRVARQATDSILLAILIVAAFAILGELTFEPIVRRAGATDNLMPYIRDYLHISFIGAAFIVGPMVAGNLMRAMGDARIPGMTMVAGAIMNLVMDPFLIFGIGPFPKMGVAGAALATVLSNLVAIAIMGYYMVRREHLIVFKMPPWDELMHSWGQVLRVGLPATATNIANPITIFVVTAAFATFGTGAVAGFGVSGRMEFFFAIPLLALSASIGPIAGQNGGAGLTGRVKDAFYASYLVAAIWTVFSAISLYLLAPAIAHDFSKEAEVQNVIITYLRIVPLTALGYGVIIATSAGFNALGRPFPGMIMTFVRSVVLVSGGAWIGAILYGVKGAAIAIALANVVSGIGAYLWFRQARLHAHVAKKREAAI